MKKEILESLNRLPEEKKQMKVFLKQTKTFVANLGANKALSRSKLVTKSFEKELKKYKLVLEKKDGFYIISDKLSKKEVFTIKNKKELIVCDGESIKKDIRFKNKKSVLKTTAQMDSVTQVIEPDINTEYQSEEIINSNHQPTDLSVPNPHPLNPDINQFGQQNQSVNVDPETGYFDASNIHQQVQFTQQDQNINEQDQRINVDISAENATQAFDPSNLQSYQPAQYPLLNPGTGVHPYPPAPVQYPSINTGFGVQPYPPAPKTDGIMLCMNIHMVLILLTPLVGIFFGAFVAYHNELSVAAFSLNIIAVVLGIPLALLLGWLQITSERYLIMLSLLVLGIMAASLLSLDIEGIHRWLAIGSTYINVSMVFVPLILYAISTSLGRYKFLPIILIVSVSVIHVLQPDAGQATAFGCAVIIIFLLTSNIPPEIRLIGIISMGIGMSLAWRQPDSLPAVLQVERILHLAVKIGSLGVAGIALSIISLLAPIFYVLKQQMTSSNNRLLAIAFIAYLVAEFCVTELGNYPVPIIGAGASSILGYYIIIGITVVRICGSGSVLKHKKCSNKERMIW